MVHELDLIEGRAMISQATTARTFTSTQRQEFELEARGADCGYEKADSADTNEGCADSAEACMLYY